MSHYILTYKGISKEIRLMDNNVFIVNKHDGDHFSYDLLDFDYVNNAESEELQMFYLFLCENEIDVALGVEMLGSCDHLSMVMCGEMTILSH